MDTLTCDSLWLNARLATCDAKHTLLDKAAMAVCAGKIVWLGPNDQLPASFRQTTKVSHDVAGRWITPGLIDCHTHLVYAANRANEFAMRLAGATYVQIAQAGGGIQSTVMATRNATFEDLYQQSAKRLAHLLAEGVTTVEIKSGYGLDLETELKMLRVAKKLALHHPVTIRTTFLGAHTLPPEYQDRGDDYIELLCQEILPKIQAEKLADAVDGFCEKIAFTSQQIAKVFQAAQRLGLAVKLHADQLSNGQGAKLAAHYSALSADHLEYTTEDGIKALAQAGTVAVLLPGAFYFLREQQIPAVTLLRKYQVPIAIATDCNPGTSPITSVLSVMNLACTLFRLTPQEALQAVTLNAARALGLAQTHGSLQVGKVADFTIWDIQELAELAYYLGFNPCIGSVKKGEIVRNNGLFSLKPVAKTIYE